MYSYHMHSLHFTQTHRVLDVGLVVRRLDVDVLLVLHQAGRLGTLDVVLCSIKIKRVK